ETVVCCGMLSHQPNQGPLTWEQILEKAEYLSRLFRGEFVFPPTTLKENLDRTLRSLEQDGVVDLSPPQGPIKHITPRPRNQNSVFYVLLLAPFIEGLYLAGASLLGIPADTPLSINTLTNSAQLLG